ncbi:hypothetical protein CNMCM5793_009282 [Aspergillus hiratsukae]|uniref:Uncharacterized protein n=1 Tax=Aspergillus hiratsukae TaxID=1194566 RepID=A0A8H6Q016_9EURO|nr:hypothetical protein CNMCM5793_009282 [Aspergillus hiratsukae]KAF7163309.1 hypothetical protein CNMCM6106_000258 [Aspergillus hiratsukae]
MPFRTSTSSKSSTSDAASTRSVSSKASTLKGAENLPKKWLSTKHKTYTNASPSSYSVSATYNEAVASYLSMR